MFQKIKDRIFPFIITLSALSVSASAAFYSVSGLSKLFAGASFEVIVMASSLEISKLVIASLLYQYRKTLPKLHSSLRSKVIRYSSGFSQYVFRAADRNRIVFSFARFQHNLGVSLDQY